MHIYISIYIYMRITVTKRSERRFLPSGLVSDCVLINSIVNIFFDLLRQEDKDYVPILYFCFPVAASHPS